MSVFEDRPHLELCVVALETPLRPGVHPVQGCILMKEPPVRGLLIFRLEAIRFWFCFVLNWK